MSFSFCTKSSPGKTSKFCNKSRIITLMGAMKFSDRKGSVKMKVSL